MYHDLRRRGISKCEGSLIRGQERRYEARDAMRIGGGAVRLTAPADRLAVMLSGPPSRRRALHSCIGGQAVARRPRPAGEA